MHGAFELPAPRWRGCRFAELTADELQFIYMARQQVFVVEQRCIFQDVDGHDPASWHLAAWPAVRGAPLAYARIIAPDGKHPQPSIGRVLTTAPARGRGLGRELVRRALDHCTQAHPGQDVCISAQSHLEAFYAGFGFVACSEGYLEDGIEHIDMRLRRLA